MKAIPFTMAVLEARLSPGFANLTGFGRRRVWWQHVANIPEGYALSPISPIFAHKAINNLSLLECAGFFHGTE